MTWYKLGMSLLQYNLYQYTMNVLSCIYITSIVFKKEKQKCVDQGGVWEY